MWLVGGRPSGPLVATVPSVEVPGGHRNGGGSVPVRVFEKLPARCQERFQRRYGRPQGVGRSRLACRGEPPYVPSVETFLAFSRRLLKNQEKSAAPSWFKPGSVSCGLSGVVPRAPWGPPYRRGSVPVRVFGKPPTRCQERFHRRYGGPQVVGPVSCGLLEVVPRAPWGPPYRRWKRSCSCF